MGLASNNKLLLGVEQKRALESSERISASFLMQFAYNYTKINFGRELIVNLTLDYTLAIPICSCRYHGKDFFLCPSLNERQSAP